MRRGSGFLSGIALLLVAASSAAGEEDTFGLGPRAMALGGSYAARPGDYAAAYYNPAGLAPGGERADHGGFFELSLGYLYAAPKLHVTASDGRELETPGVPTSTGVFLGTRFSVGQPFDLDGLNMGLSVYVPERLFRWTIRPDDDVEWALLTDRTQVVSANASIGYAVTPWLSLGAGLRVMFDVQTLTRGRVTSVEYDEASGKVRTHTVLGTDSQVFGRVAPLFGVLVTPTDTLRVGLTYRHRSYVDDWGDTRIRDVPILSNMGYTHRFAHYFEPSQLTLALGADLSDSVDVSVDVTYAAWSQALSTNHNAFNSPVWGDTVTPAAGARWRANQALSLLGGYRFQKSPLGNFGGPSNLLDNDRHVVSVGLESELSNWLHPSLGATATLALEEILLVSRSETKDYRRFQSDSQLQKNPGYPGYDYGGSVMAVSFGLEAKW
ncbi:MAG: outer membrane protein transport protein [Myxococcales bacterium]|nr:outer membrane protein transport protein [Myxococcales bacterium]